VYDGDGVRVKGTVAGAVTAYVGNHFEWTGSTSTMKKYYYAGGTRVAVRTGTADPLWLLGDHLGSTSITTDSDLHRSPSSPLILLLARTLAKDRWSLVTQFPPIPPPQVAPPLYHLKNPPYLAGV
jgi:hypothetical protein